MTIIDLDLSRYDQIAQRFSREQEEGVAFLKSGIATRNARSRPVAPVLVLQPQATWPDAKDRITSIILLNNPPKSEADLATAHENPILWACERPLSRR